MKNKYNQLLSMKLQCGNSTKKSRRNSLGGGRGMKKKPLFYMREFEERLYDFQGLAKFCQDDNKASN